MTRYSPWYAVALFAFVIISGCSGSSGQLNEEGIDTSLNDQSSGSNDKVYPQGNPPALNTDVENFQQYLWSKVARDDRCGACHIETEISPQFARSDDINLAYAAANNIVDLAAPSQSP